MVMTSKIIKIHNFFKNPDNVRKQALDFNYLQPTSQSNWHGIRSTLPRRVIAGIDLEQKIYEGILSEIPDVTYEEMDIFFHILPEYVRLHFKDPIFENSTKHYDDSICTIVGVIYLTPNPPKNSGTSFFNDEGNKIEEIENIYNTMIIYPANTLHGPTNPFGTTIENSRLTITFFLKK
jgi:hypothetical protein